jgi:hypothetical protein
VFRVGIPDVVGVDRGGGKGACVRPDTNVRVHYTEHHSWNENVETKTNLFRRNKDFIRITLSRFDPMIEYSEHQLQG